MCKLDSRKKKWRKLRNTLLNIQNFFYIFHFITQLNPKKHNFVYRTLYDTLNRFSYPATHEPLYTHFAFIARVYFSV